MKGALRILQIGAIVVVLVATTQTAFDLDRFLVPKELVLHVTACLAALAAFGGIRRMAFTRVDLFLILYLLLSAVSAATATNRWLGFRALAVSASGVLIFWTARALRDAGLERPLLNALAIAVVIAAITSLLQAYGMRIPLFAVTRVPGGTLGNRNFVAHVAAFGLPLFFLVALRSRYFLASIGVAIVTASLVLTRSRGAWIAAAVMFVIFILFARTWGRLMGVIAFAAAGVVAALVIPNTLRWRSENPYLESVTGVANYEQGSGRGRLVQYEHSLGMAATHALLGVGPGNWAVEYPAFAGRSDPSLNPSEPGMTLNPWPSSDWVAFVSERGLIAAVILLLAFFFMALTPTDDPLIRAGLLAIIAATLVAGIFDAVLLLAVPTFIVWAALGALMTPRAAASGPRSAFVVILLLITVVGAARSGAQLVAMSMYGGGRSALESAAAIDPGNYRIQLRLASRCAHARAAHALYPHAEEARAAARRCGR
jgi:O-antigen ligase